ncbi:MAG: 3-isopropylmalate dehydratase small subunit, partial [Alphaproteobacteria bacterium]
KLLDDAERGANATLSIDLEAQEIRGPDGGMVAFDVDPFRKRCLLEGLDDIALSLEKSAAINAFEAKSQEARPWL